MIINPEHLDFSFGARQVNKELQIERKGEGLKLISIRNQLINFDNNTELCGSPKFNSKVRIKDLSLFIRTAFTSGGQIQYALKRLNDELIPIAGFSSLASDQNGEANIILEPGERIVCIKQAGLNTDAGAFDSNVDGEFA